MVQHHRVLRVCMVSMKVWLRVLWVLGMGSGNRQGNV